MKRWPQVTSPAAIPSISNETISAVSCRVANVHTMTRNGRTQRKASGFAETAPQRIHSAKGTSDDRRNDLGNRVLRLAARLLDHCDIKLALLRVGLDARVLKTSEPCALQKALDRGFRRADARAPAFLARVSLSSRQADDMQRQAPRGDKTLRAFVKQIALDERAGDEPLEILRRLSLHAGGDFFAEQFEQKVGHGAGRRQFEGNNSNAWQKR